jgi:hypothetical protein
MEDPMKPPKNWNPFHNEDVVMGMQVLFAFLLVYAIAAWLLGM